MQRQLGFYSLGNGISVADSLHEKDGDYVSVAHINVHREVTYYIKHSKLPSPVQNLNLKYLIKTALLTVAHQ